MNLEDYLLEVELGQDSSLSEIFNVALTQVFSQEYLKKINSVLKKRIGLKYISEREDINAYNKGNVIYVNKNNFEKLDSKQQVRTLLHEFIHILQNSKKFLIFFRQFKEIHNLSKELGKIVKNSLIEPISVFLNSRYVKALDTDYEIIPYLMSGNINWKAISPAGRRDIKIALKNSGIFNLHHQFWVKRT